MIFVLGSPLAVVIFLKYFGVNQFELPIFHKNGPEWEREWCDYNDGQHFVNFPLEMNELMQPGKSAILVGNYFEEYKSLTNTLNRIPNTFDKAILDFFLIISETQIVDDLSADIIRVSLSQNTSRAFNDCQLILANRYQFVLIDTQNRIRGYYDLSDEEEMERLIVEVKVMLYDGQPKN